MYRKLTLAFVILGATVSCYAGDLDDGISSYTDDSISEHDTLGSVDLNVSYIVLHAKSRASMVGQQEAVVTGDDNTGNINSVVLRPGSNVYGDIILIDQSTGDKNLTISASEIYGALQGQTELSLP